MNQDSISKVSQPMPPCECGSGKTNGHCRLHGHAWSTPWMPLPEAQKTYGYAALKSELADLSESVRVEMAIEKCNDRNYFQEWG